MSRVVVTGASISCPFGTSTGSFIATNCNYIKIKGITPGNTNDGLPIINITPFGMCQTPTNPAVAAATAAALGVLTPMPCIPNTKTWAPTNPKVMVGGKPVLTQESVCLCRYGGVITVSDPGQTVLDL